MFVLLGGHFYRLYFCKWNKNEDKTLEIFYELLRFVTISRASPNMNDSMFWFSKFQPLFWYLKQRYFDYFQNALDYK